jgi:hypothetical protein
VIERALARKDRQRYVTRSIGFRESEARSISEVRVVNLHEP